MWSSTLRRAKRARLERSSSRLPAPTEHGCQAPEPDESGWVEVAQFLARELNVGHTGWPLIREWSLVLMARRVRHRKERTSRSSKSWRLLVPAELYGEACREITAYVRENRNLPVARSAPPMVYANSTATLVVLAALAWFHTISNPGSGGNALELSLLGRANSQLIHSGEWWRLVTALTLHGDYLHLLANLGFGGVIFVLLCRELGSGLGWFLTLCAGVLGNWFNYQVHTLDHVSLGASTAVFGAVGVMGGVQAALQALSGGRELRKILLPVGAGLLLLGWLGSSGEDTDLGAHFFGFIAGVGVGAAAGTLIAFKGRPSRVTQIALACISVGVLALAWWRAVS